MAKCDLLIRNAFVVDGTGSAGEFADVAIVDGNVVELGHHLQHQAATIREAGGHVLAPGFIDVHTHDDTSVIRTPQMLPKLSQGVTTVIVGNCGISAAPITPGRDLPDPMQLLGTTEDLCYPTFASYVAAVDNAPPAVNVAALVGHTTLRSNYLDQLDRTASADEIASMGGQLEEALTAGALGLSTGLAYLSAYSASSEEVIALAQPLAASGAIYTTHMRTEGAAILEAMAEAFHIGQRSQVPVIISHLKCAGVDNWGRSAEVLEAFDARRNSQPIGCDCYPYAAGSSTLDLRQVDPRVLITITWSEPHPEMAGQSLAAIAALWNLDQVDAARRLQPAGAIYHSISEQDMRRILQHPATMIGSDGLPHDPRPHPRLWGTFPRVLGRYCREEKLFPLQEAVHKMTGMPARRFGLADRGRIRPGAAADLVLFDPEKIIDTATFKEPVQPAEGILSVWVNGRLAYEGGQATGVRAGRFLRRTSQAKQSENYKEW
jgi:N-acyl-D-amino-acid deacylase